MAVIYTLTKSPLVKSGGQLYWNIDSPSEQQPLKIVNGRIVLRGWLVAEGEADSHVAVKIDHMTYSFPFNTKRPDVISAILKSYLKTIKNYGVDLISVFHFLPK